MDIWQKLLSGLSSAAELLVYAAIVVVFAVGVIKCVAPVASNRRRLLRGIRRVRSGATRNDWQEDKFLGKGALLPHWEAYLKNLFFADGAYHDASSVEDFINEETVISGPGRSAFAEGVPGLLVSLGFMGTLIGLVHGLSDFNMTDSAAVQQSIVTLVPGMRYAFMTSIFGVVASVTFTVMVRWINGSTEKVIRDFYSAMNRYAGVESVDPMTQITIYQQEQTALIQTMAKDLNGRFTEKMADVISDSMKPLEKALRDYVTVSSKEQMRFLDAVTMRFMDRMEQALGNSFRTLGQTLDRISEKESAAFAETESALREIRRLTEEARDVHAAVQDLTASWRDYINTLSRSQIDTEESYEKLVSEAEKLELVSLRQNECLVKLTEVADRLENAGTNEVSTTLTEREEAFRTELLQAVWDMRDELLSRSAPPDTEGSGEDEA